MDKCIYINKSRIEDNLDYYKEKTNKEIIAIVKNNAYGLGVKEVSSIIDSRVKMYGVSNLKEARELKKYTSKDILILDRIDDYRRLDQSMIVTIVSIKHLKELIKLDKEIRVHLKINVMMKRKGVNVNEVEVAINLINNSKLKLEGIYTHYSSYKVRDVRKQFKIFKDSIANVDATSLIIHASSSISSLNFYEDFTNYIRVGVGMYGLKKLDKCMDDLKVSIRVVCYSKNVYKIDRIDRFSYHNLYIGKKGYVVMVNLGYGDGFFYRKLKGYINEKLIKEIGKENMDNMYFYSDEYVFDNSEIEIFGDNISMDKYSIKRKIPVCKILAMLNRDIVKIIEN